MLNGLLLVLGTLASYLLGAIPVSFLIGRATKGIDIRQHGSGNVGATNVFRVVGKAAGALALVGDVVKGALAVSAIPAITQWLGASVSVSISQCLFGVAAVCGHVWPVFLRFKGGKGVATSLGVLLGLAPGMAALGILIWLIVAAFTRYVSVSSIAATLGVTLLMAGSHQALERVVLSAALSMLIVVRHHANLKRLFRSSEHQISPFPSLFKGPKKTV